MNTLIREVDALAAEMDALEKFNDDVFIQFFEKEEALQERLSEAVKAGKLTDEEYKEYSTRLADSFGKLKGKLSFCTLH